MPHTNDLVPAIRRAVKWLRDNPDRHIVGALAIKANGVDCRPNDPDASCFCILGRISHELDLPSYPNYDTKTNFEFAALGINPDDLYRQNDRPQERKLAFCPNASVANPAVLDKLDEVLRKPTLIERIKSWLKK